MQGFEDLVRDYAADDVIVIDVLVQDAGGGAPTVEDAAMWKDVFGLSYPILADVDGAFFQTYGHDTDVFVFYVIDRDGAIVWTEAREGDDTLALILAEVDALLAD